MARGPSGAGYEIARCEQVFWQMNRPGVRLNRYLRLFDKRQGRLTEMPVHAAPEVAGALERLEHPLFHFGEPDIHTKVDKVNRYSSGLVAEKVGREVPVTPLTMIAAAPWAFLRNYFLKRGFMDGWAGFIASTIMAFYAFLKYAKLYEHRRRRSGDASLPAGAPRIALPSVEPGEPKE